jgi:hypothetical protein
MHSVELFGARQQNEKIDFKQFEEKHGITIPSEFQTFANVFELGRDDFFIGKFRINRYYNDEIGFVMACGRIEMILSDDGIIKNIILDRFIDNESLLEEWESAVLSESLYQRKFLLPIGFLYEPVHTRIFLGVGKSNFGQIWVDVNEEIRLHNDIDSLLVAPNIWDFVSRMEEKISRDFLIKNDPTKLFKNWGEDFWRVRDID